MTTAMAAATTKEPATRTRIVVILPDVIQGGPIKLGLAREFQISGQG
jgi:hypothetical protein